MYSPYKPNLTTPDVANPMEETFEAKEFNALLSFGRASLKPGLGAAKGGIKQSIKGTLKSIFKSPRRVRSLMKGNSEQVIESAIQNPNTAADSLATQTTKYVNVTRGEQLIESSGDWIRQLKAAQPNWKPGDPDVLIDGVTYTDEILEPFYRADGTARSTTLSTNAERAGDGGDILVKAGGQTDEQVAAMNKSLRKLEEGYEGNPIKSSMDDLTADGGKLSDEAIEQVTRDIATGNKGVYSADYAAGIAPKKLTDLPADDIAKRSRFGGRGATAVGAVFLAGAGLWTANNFLERFASSLFGGDCTRETYESRFPDATSDEIDIMIDECLDDAADRILYLGGAVIGFGFLLVLFVLGRVFKKRN
tara:strand:- start:8450 stop:9538 length:1089 start_codon:yes stop_codon:yes gene_type:complete